MPTIMNVVGARPQLIKAGPVSKALRESGAEEILLHTGQHYDHLMSAAIMKDIGLRDPDVNLGVGSGTHGAQTAEMLLGIEKLLLKSNVDVVLTYGDTNSTIAGALAAAKLGILTAHVEAGLRSFNRAMPEELNRVATDHLSDLLFAPTRTAVEHLEREGLSHRTTLTGDVMVDALLSVDYSGVELPQWADGEYYAATIHRPENTDDASRLAEILRSLSSLNRPVHLMAHPRLAKMIDTHGIAAGAGLLLHDPLPYAKMLATVKASCGLITDSGGLQKEAFILRVPCITLRSETEWPETLTGRWNVLADPSEDLVELTKRTVETSGQHPFGEGRAAAKIVQELMGRL